jgi:branched-chain amino acid transport system substrate-binding protein
MTTRAAATTGINRRKFLAATSALAASAAFPLPSIAQARPVKIGLMTVKTGPLAAGGQHMEAGINAYLKQTKYTMAGRPVDLLVADTGGSPAGAKTKAQELVERDKVDLIIGPFAAFELLATVDYLAQNRMPTLAFAGAEDVTQRKANAFLTRISYTSAQSLYPMADYAAKEMKLKRAATIADDFAFGYEQVGGFQRVLEDNGGRVEKKLWSPLNTPDYAPYVAQVPGDCDMVCVGLAGSNPLKFVNAARGLGLKQQFVGGSTTADDTIVGQFNDGAIGLVNANPYSFDTDTPANHRFIDAMHATAGANVPIGHYACCIYVSGMIVDAALQKSDGKIENPEALVKAIRTVSLAETPRGAVSFDDHGNIVCDMFVRRIEKQNGKLMNKTVKVYPKVSQFWTYDPTWFLAQPVYSRDYPPMKG